MPGVATFKAEQWLPYPVEQVFRFFADPKNLPPLMPGWQKTRIDEIALVAPEAAAGEERGASARRLTLAGQGSRMTITLRPVPFSPIRMKWRARITEFKWNEYFCDEQESGPFRFWKHCHRVRSQSHNACRGTLVTDEVAYQLPFGLLGRAANAVAVRGQIGQLFAHRQRSVERLLREVEGALLQE